VSLALSIKKRKLVVKTLKFKFYHWLKNSRQYYLLGTDWIWKQPRCPTTNKWIKKMWYLYTMEFYSAMKKNEILSLTSKLMELENNILNEVSQKAKNCMLSLICGL
jgi:excinuclease UvrABC nuclease subunit